MELGFSEIDTMFENIGYGKITPLQILSKVIPQEKIPQIIPTIKRKRGMDQGIRVHGISNLMVKFADVVTRFTGIRLLDILPEGAAYLFIK